MVNQPLKMSIFKATSSIPGSQSGHLPPEVQSTQQQPSPEIQRFLNAFARAKEAFTNLQAQQQAPQESIDMIDEGTIRLHNKLVADNEKL